MADVLATNGVHRAVFEVQWSRQQFADYEARQAKYEESGITSVAWFARHAEALHAPSRKLQVLSLHITTENEPIVSIGDVTLPLAEAVTPLLTRRLRRREFVGGEDPASARVAAARHDCYRCQRTFVVWDVESLTALGRCGVPGTRAPGPVPVLERHRYEELPAVRQVIDRVARSLRTPPADLKLMSSRSAGTTYMGLVCPFSGALSGENFVHDQFGHERPAAVVTAEMPPVPVYKPHWCLDRGEGLCLEPSLRWADALRSSGGGATARVVSVKRILDIAYSRSMARDLPRPWTARAANPARTEAPATVTVNDRLPGFRASGQANRGVRQLPSLSAAEREGRPSAMAGTPRVIALLYRRHGGNACDGE